MVVMTTPTMVLNDCADNNHDNNNSEDNVG